MNIKYKKAWRRSIKICIYIFVGCIFIGCNIFSLINSLRTENASGGGQTTALFISFLLECLGFLYFLVQDTTNLIKNSVSKFVFNNEAKGIPFVDRMELLEDIIGEVEKKINENGSYYTKNIRYDKRNGKTSLAKKLCYEFQKIKDRDKDAIKVSSDKFYKKIGQIIYINYYDYKDAFNSRIKTEFTYIKGKKNIIVVDNGNNDLCLWTNDLADKDIFFVFLNYNESSDNALFFSDDKIKELLIELQKIPAFSFITVNKTEREIDAIASRLGTLSNNNIGTIIDLLSSDDFSILLKTDAKFIKFYFAIKHGRYDEAKRLYDQIPTKSLPNKVFKYKVEFEGANLIHFLGDYQTALEKLNELFAILVNDEEFIESQIGKSLYIDIVLLIAHVEKHQGEFEKAVVTLNNIPSEQRNLSWLRSTFAINILILNTTEKSNEWQDILNRLSNNMEQFKEARRIKNSDYYFYEAYYPIVSFYEQNFDKKSIQQLIKTEEQAIAFYEKEERRYLTNCYFIKAELYRIERNWKKAEEFYNQCYNIYCHNGDKDILYLVAITCKYIKCLENMELNIPFDWDEAINECKQREDYRFHNHLISKLDLANKDNKIRKDLINRYRITITPIP